MGTRAVGVLAFALVVSAATRPALASNMLVNGNLDSTGSADVYYDGFTPNVADDVPGWFLFLGAADGSYALVNQAPTPFDVDMGVGPAGGGLMTAPGSRPAVAATTQYLATVTYDNYFAPTLPEYFIDWFDVGGNLLSSNGTTLGDPNGPLTFAPYTQLFSIIATAPAGAVSAGVRFDGGNAGYAGLTADNFTFDLVPEPGSFALLGLGAAFTLRRRRRRRRRRRTARA